MDGHLLPVFNKLQDVLNKASIASDVIALPRIVVIGSQSAGKSSVLESLVRRDFLPRSNNICTRRPLELRLRNISDGNGNRVNHDHHEEEDAGTSNSNTREYAVFGHLPNQRFYDFELVKQEIVNQTSEVAGSGKAISDRPIVLEIYSPKVAPLSLVDLPGITKVPVGDQPQNIEKLTEDLAMRYIEQADTIILAVSAANVDIANSDALKLARRVDPKGNRTIGVLTKLDLMDKGTSARDLLSDQGDVILRHGFIGVVCRSQADTSKAVDEAIEKENEFLQSQYPSIAKVNGSLFLGKRLSDLLISAIKRELPNIKERIRSKLTSVNERIRILGEPVSDLDGQLSQLRYLLKSYANSFRATLDGDDLQNHESGGSRLLFCFHESFEKRMMKLSPLEGLSDSAIRTAIVGANGLQTSLSVPERAFRKLVRTQILQLKSPCLQLVDLIVDEMRTISVQAQTPEMKRFAILCEKIDDVVRSLFDSKAEETRQMVSNIINIELAHINTRHPSFSKEVMFQPHAGEARKRSASFSTLNRVGSMGAIIGEAGGLDMTAVGKSRSKLNSGSITPSFASASSSSTDTFGFLDSQHQQQPLQRQTSAQDSFFLDYILKHTKSDNNLPAAIKLQHIPYSIGQFGAGIDEDVDRGAVIVKSLLESYMKIVHTTLTDMIPKTIICFLSNACQDDLYEVLENSLHKRESVSRLLDEGEDVQSERLRCKRVQLALHEASKILDEIHGF